MAPDRGDRSNTTYKPIRASSDLPPSPRSSTSSNSPPRRTQSTADTADENEEDLSPSQILAARASSARNFTFRGVVVGLFIGIIICFSNTYFGLQTGWISGMAMPSALVGFAWFRITAKWISYPFSPVENVLVQSVAGSVGTMPLGCGFVGVIPALEYLMTPEEGGPLRLSTWKLIVWAVGICFFGVVFAVPLRRQVIIREKLKFPSGTATALMIGVLHGNRGEAKIVDQNDDPTSEQDYDDESHRNSLNLLEQRTSESYVWSAEEQESRDVQGDWRQRIKLLLWSFAFSGIYTLVSYFIPQIRNIPIFGLKLANDWLWTLNPSPAYVGQGIIMGPSTTLHMLLGAIIGWAFLSPLAKREGWAPGPVDDWTTGSKGWIVWVSLAIMLADSLVSLGWLVVRPLKDHGPDLWRTAQATLRQNSWKDIVTLRATTSSGYQALGASTGTPDTPTISKSGTLKPDEAEADAPPEHLISNRTTSIGLVLSLLASTFAVHYAFSALVPIYYTLLALLFALLLSIMGVRALGETDLNPVSGISKLTQLIFAFIVPKDNKNAVVINLVAGALSESGALQAGDLMQDLKAGHLLGAAPNAQFWGQMIGSAVGAVASALVYRLYTKVYTIPGGQFQVPTGFVWIFTARLVTGKGLPEKVGEWALGAGAVFAATTALRICGREKGGAWRAWVPGGIAVAVGMYNTPSFTLARTIGGLLSLYWQRWLKKQETPLIVLASGLILGEGLISIVNLVMASLKVPHL